MKYEDITADIISHFYRVYNILGFGFLEKVYENALKIELELHGYIVETQRKINVFYKGHQVGEYYADLVVNNLIVLELKANESVAEENLIQLNNYLKATDKEVGLLLNFGKKPEVRRRIFDNDKK